MASFAVSSATARLRRLGLVALDLLLPPRCLACGGPVPRQGEVCTECWQGLGFITAPFCRLCALPLPHVAAADPVCSRCLLQPPPFDRARAALRYDEGSKRLILGFKHRERLEAVPTLAAWLGHAGRDILAEADLVVPVPLHRWRLLKRGFNQSAMLARPVAARAGKPCLPGLLLRRRATRSQQGLGAAERGQNITAAAFDVARRHRPAVAGARIVLVDDVLTTGATLGACVDVLKRHGAQAVDVLVLARVVQDGSIPI